MISDIARQYATNAAHRLFIGRTGHGGGPCMKRNLTEAELTAIIAIAFDQGRRHPLEQSK